MSHRSGPIRFANLSVAPETRRLTGPAGDAELQDKPLRLLLALLRRAGEVVHRPELQAALWPPDLHVEREAGLNTAMRKLRQALRAVGAASDLVETVPGIGYRLDVATDAVAHPEAEHGRSRSGPSARRAGWAAAAALAALAATVIFSASGASPDGRAEALPDDAETRAQYVEARGHVGRGDFDTAHELFAAVTEAAPAFAPGHAHRAEVAALLALGSGDQRLVVDAETASERALALAPDLAVGLRARALLDLHFHWDLAAARLLLERGARNDPDDPLNFLALAGYHSIVGEHHRAIELVERAVSMAPDTMAIRSDAGYFLLRAERYEEGVRECEMVLRLAPDNEFGRRCLLEAHARLGNTEATRRAARLLMRAAGAPVAEQARLAGAADPERIYRRWALTRLESSREPPAVNIAVHHARLEQTGEALRWLEAAAARRSPSLIYVPAGPAFASMRSLPRYRAILRQAGLADLLTS